MKVVFTILFFADTIALVVLTYLLLHLIDAGKSGTTIIEITGGMLLSIFLMILFVYRYLKTSGSSGRK
ncbi:MAG: hypothetical protein EOO02_01730 [Chitinophagaceae bacterium]|nr:MAG: hypothetical protein EOO02_01730 [Chitinophagaceae bacterium]